MTDREKAPQNGTIGRVAAPDATEVRPALVGVTGAAFAVIAVLIGVDVAGDTRAGGSWGHAAIELALMAIAVTAAVVVWWHFLALRRQARLLVRDLGVAQAEADRWRREADDVLRGLGAAIDSQFERWELSAAEREIALLLLKGLALKEIADVRRTSERTVRQQALAVYRKAGLAGRAELSAFFLEDLLLPGTVRAPAAAPDQVSGSMPSATRKRDTIA